MSEAVQFSPEYARVLNSRVNHGLGHNVFTRDAHGQLWMNYDAVCIHDATRRHGSPMTEVAYYYKGKHIVSMHIPGTIGPNSLTMRGITAQIAIDEAALQARQTAPADAH